MKRRVVLINPRVCTARSTRFPLSLLALAAVLEDRWQVDIVDANFEADPASRVRALLEQDDVALVGVTVMPGPQVAPAIAVSTMVRRLAPGVPIAWGGYFPTLYPDAAINAPYVDFVVRGQGEETVLELLERLDDDAGPGRRPADGLPASPGDARALAEVRGLTFRGAGEIVHNPERPFRPPDAYPLYPYRRLPGATDYPRPSFLGARTVAHQAAIGCRFRCNFCGVVSMFNGYTELQGPDRLDATLTTLRDEYGADSVQYYDHNFFDREDSSVATLEVLARHRMPWWCFARTDALANFSAGTWKLIEKSGLRMTYLGAEAASDDVLRTMKKGTRVEQTMEAARRCQEHGVIPELSFILGGPEDPEGEIERTFAFIRRLKAMVPSCEIVLYFYSPTPQRDRVRRARENDGARIPVLDAYGPGGDALPTTPEEWTEKHWVDYICHLDAPWLTPALRRRVKDFSKVLACRFPTVQDYHTPGWGKAVLRSLSGWRYASGWYGKPWELDVARRLVRLREPQRESL